MVRGAGQLESLPRHLLEETSLQQASSGPPGPSEWLVSTYVHSRCFLHELSGQVCDSTGSCPSPCHRGQSTSQRRQPSEVHAIQPGNPSSRKCVAELGPEATGVLKVLLVIWAPSLWRQSSPAILQQSGNTPLLKILQDTSGSHVTETSLPSQS